MKEKIEKLGDNFRGLWKSCEFDIKDGFCGDLMEDRWCVTFVYKNKYVETPYYDTAEEALDFALKTKEQEESQITF